MNAITPIAGKLGKLLKLLTSDRAGEVVAAARALMKTLDGAGLDIHALVANLGLDGKRFSEADAAEIYRRGVEDGRQQAEAERDDDANDGFARDVSVEQWGVIAWDCLHHRFLHGAHERDFVESMVARCADGREPTEKQAAWLRKIYARGQ
jgi:hypothetical protein